MTNKTLRALAKDYANGVLDKDAYRKARDSLLNGILSGKVAIVTQDFRPPLQEQDLNSTYEKTEIQMVAPPREKEPRPTTEFVPPPKTETNMEAKNRGASLKLYIILGTVIVAITVVVLAAIFSESEEITLTATDSISVSPDEQISSGQNISAPQLIEEFLNRRDWSDDHLQQFATRWNNLSPDEQANGLAPPVSIQLANAIYKQLLEERSLFGTGNNDAIIARQHTLVNFANTLGIDDPRLKIREAPQPFPVYEPESDIQASPVTTPPPAEDDSQETDASETRIDTDTTANESTAAIVADIANDEVISTDMTETATPSTPGFLPPLEKTESPQLPVLAEEKTVPAVSNKNACVPSLAKQRAPYCRDTIDGADKGPTLAVIPGGKFMMGGDKPNEQPKHEVEIRYPLAISVNEITQEEFELFCIDAQKQCPAQPWSDKDYPVVNVSWNDVVAYTTWLAGKTGNPYRLPSEAEWEYAARANTTTKYPFGDEILITDAVFSGIKPLIAPLPRSDRSINRNQFRLYHMVGNVREWVSDSWRDNYNNASSDGSTYIDSNSKYRVVRGGSYADNADSLRSSARVMLLADSADIYTGFRIVQELDR